MKEIWKDIKGFEGRYQVSNLGRVCSFIANHNGRNNEVLCYHILKYAYDRTGYQRVVLTDSGKKKHSCFVHRLVAAAFIGDPDGMQINHKDGIKSHNYVDNLEICDQSYNTIHAYRFGLMKPCDNGMKKKVRALKDGLVIGIYTSIRLMCRSLNLDRRSVLRVLDGTYEHHHGLKFEFI